MRGEEKEKKRGLWVNTHTLYIIQEGHGSSTPIHAMNTYFVNFDIFLNGIPCLPISKPQHLLQGKTFMLNSEEKGKHIFLKNVTREIIKCKT